MRPSIVAIRLFNCSRGGGSVGGIVRLAPQNQGNRPPGIFDTRRKREGVPRCKHIVLLSDELVWIEVQIALS